MPRPKLRRTIRRRSPKLFRKRFGRVPRSAWLPTDMPLLARDLIERGRRRQTYLIRAALAAVFAVVFGFSYASLARSADSLVTGLGRGRDLVTVLLTIEFVAAILLIPALAGGAIVRERHDGTLDLLRVSGLHPVEIVWQKYLAVMLTFTVLLFAALPFYAIAYAMGGVETIELLLGNAAVLLTAAILAATTLAASARQPTFFKAVKSGALYAIGWGWLLQISVAIAAWGASLTTFGTYEFWLIPFTAVAAFLIIQHQIAIASRDIANVGVDLDLARKQRQSGLVRSRRARGAAYLKNKDRRLGHTRPTLRRARRRQAYKNPIRLLRRHPVYWRESLPALTAAWPAWTWPIIAVAVGATLGRGPGSGIDFTIAAAILVFFTAARFARPGEHRACQLMLTTSLSAPRIVWEKLASLRHVATSVWLALAAASLSFFWFDQLPPEALIDLLAIHIHQLLILAFLVILTAWAGLRFHHTHRALIVPIAFVLVIWIGPHLLPAALQTLGSPTLAHHARHLALATPTALADLLDAADLPLAVGRPGYHAAPDHPRLLAAPDHTIAASICLTAWLLALTLATTHTLTQSTRLILKNA